MRTFACVALALCLIGCGDDSSKNDMAPADLSGAAHDMKVDMACDNSMPAASDCGHRCDSGNSKGIGQYCDDQVSCRSGLLCTHLFQPTTYFCTTQCTPDANNMDAAKCGENTLCQCTGLGCGCTPAACTMPQG